MTTNSPVSKLRDGAIQASIFANRSEKGSFFSVQFSRTYQDDAGNYHNSSSFSGAELLKLSRLAQKAYDEIAELHQAERDTATEAAA